MSFQKTKNPVSIRLSFQEISTLRKLTHTKKVSEAVRTLLQMEVERRNQVELLGHIHGTMKPSDFDASSL